ncbi:MAG: hypothetical protein DRI61_09600 [Chloroflexi bacterium]|nr:MAG: hypothetical protein DRI61_09600 [Chloroflexota bacterium]
MWSEKEFRYLTGVEKPTGNTKRVLKHRIRKKALDNLRALELLFRRLDIWEDKRFAADFIEELSHLACQFSEVVSYLMHDEAHALLLKAAEYKKHVEELEGE